MVARRIGDRTILVPTGRSIADHRSLFTLNETGSHIWEDLAQPRTLAEIQDSLARHFDASPEQLRADIERFVEEMKSTGCILEDAAE